VKNAVTFLAILGFSFGLATTYQSHITPGEGEVMYTFFYAVGTVTIAFLGYCNVRHRHHGTN
jgi:hypothetical protein